METMNWSAHELTMTVLMTPDMANFSGNVHGGTILKFLDSVAYACASRYSASYVVTLSVDQVMFLQPIHVGELVTFLASINYTGRTSMEVGIRVVTECSGGDWAPGWRDGLLHFARTLMVDAVRNQARGVALGNLALDQQGGPRTGGCRTCRGVMTVANDGAVRRNPEYYALAHASLRALPGAWRVESSAGREGIDNVAFLNPDGTLALVVVNSAPQARSFTVRAAGQGYGYTLPAASVATFTWRMPAAP